MSGLYDSGREAFLDGAISWTGDDIKAILVDLAEYTVALDTHTELADVPVAARTAISPNLGGKDATDGVADANDVTFSSVTGAESAAVILYVDDGADNPLIAYIDQAVSGLPVTPNGGDITVVWDNGANKIFKL